MRIADLSARASGGLFAAPPAETTSPPSFSFAQSLDARTPRPATPPPDAPRERPAEAGRKAADPAAKPGVRTKNRPAAREHRADEATRSDAGPDTAAADETKGEHPDAAADRAAPAADGEEPSEPGNATDGKVAKKPPTDGPPAPADAAALAAAAAAGAARPVAPAGPSLPASDAGEKAATVSDGKVKPPKDAAAAGASVPSTNDDPASAAAVAAADQASTKDGKSAASAETVDAAPVAPAAKKKAAAATAIAPPEEDATAADAPAAGKRLRTPKPGTRANANTDAVDPAAAALAASGSAAPAIAGNDSSDADASSSDASPAARAIAGVGGLSDLASLTAGAPASKAGAGAPTQSPATTTGAAARASAEADFAEANHAKIVGAVHGQLLPTGGTMRVRLDPPELGAMLITVKMHEGAMTASFETSNDQATQLLSHNLSQLKTALESGGVSVDHLHVQQTIKPSDAGGKQGGNGDSPRDGGAGPGGREAEQERQRKELLQRMWKKLSIGSDPLDLVA